MSDGFPSMTALLGLLAVAGYQNRDKIAEMLGGAHGPPGSPPVPGQAAQPGGLVPGQAAQPGGLGGLLGNLRGANAGGFLSGGLGELVQRFQQNGQGPVAQSWVNQGPNQPIAPHQVEQAIGPDVLATLTQKTGLSREELLSRLATALPQAVDKYTPDGRIPT